jgi:hypothetical protein
MSTTPPILDWGASFDTTSSLAALYLWIMFNALFSLLNCDLQRALNKNMFVKHLTGLLAFYFLFNIVDPNNKSHVATTLVKTFVVYALFIMATKSKWPYIAAALLLLFCDQVMRNHIEYLKNAERDPSSYVRARFYIQWAIFGVILVGFLHYFARQRFEYGQAFSFGKFILGTTSCKDK